MEDSMVEIELKEDIVPYRKALLEAWINGDYSMLTSSTSSDYIKKIIVRKAKKRPGTRFFGESFVSSLLYKKMNEGWYSSYQWLTSDQWLTGKSLTSRFEKLFYEALHTHLGTDPLTKIQNNSKNFLYKNKIKPRAPDLWLIDKSGEHHFIECKKGSDKIHCGQIESLAIIKKYLKCLIRIINLYPEGSKLPKQIDYTEIFSRIYESLPD